MGNGTVAGQYLPDRFPNWANILLATNRNNKRLNNLFFFISKTHIVIVTKMDKRAKHTDCF